MNGVIEVIDAASGRTLGTFERDALELENVPRNNLNYYYAAHRLETDVARGFAYLMSANRDGVHAPPI